MTAPIDFWHSTRQIGGIHFQDGDLHARATGTDCGKTAYTKAKGYFKKTA